MMEAEQLHVLPPEENIDVTNIVNCFDGSSSISTCSSKSEHNDVSKTSNEELYGVHTSAIGDTSSAASSIDFVIYSPEQTLTNNQSRVESRESNIDADIDEYVQSMLASAGELSCISTAGTSSMKKKDNIDNNNLKKSETTDLFVEKNNSDNGSIHGSNNFDFSSCSTSPTTKSPCYASQLDSIISELNLTVMQMKLAKPSRISPDDYTSHEHLDKSSKKNKNSGTDNLHQSLERTTSWAAKLPKTKPYFPTSVPSTPLISRTRSIKNNNRESKIITQTSKSNSNIAITIPSLGSRNSTSKPYLISPVVPLRPYNNNERIGRSYKREGIVIENPYIANRSSNKESLDTSLSSLDISSAIQNSSSLIEEKEGPDILIDGSRIDDFFDSRQQYLYQFQPCDKLEHCRELALNRLSRYVDKSVFMKIKHFGMKMGVFKNFKNKINRPLTSDIPIDGLFGLPLNIIQARNGNGLPFPQFFIDIIEYFKENAVKSCGILRKCGSAKNVQIMRNICSKGGTQNPLPENYKRMDLVNDLNDLMKQYLRAIPNKIVPESITEIFMCALKANDPSKHLLIIRYILLLLPDENREALFYLLDFLSEVAKYSDKNMMTIRNIVICTQPSIFACDNVFSITPTAGRNRRKTVAVLPSKGNDEYTYLQRAFELMIENHNEVKLIPSDLINSTKAMKKKKTGKDALPPLEEIGDAASIRNFVKKLFDEYENGWQYWQNEKISTESGVKCYAREVNDSCSTKSSRFQLIVKGSPQEIFKCIMDNEKRRHWDYLTIWTRTAIVDPQNNEEVGQMIFNTYNNVQKQAYIVRAYELNEENTGRAYIAEKSCRHAINVADDFVDVYHNVFMLCPINNNRTEINYITRVDIKGKSSEWYKTTFRDMMISQMDRISTLATDETLFKKTMKF